LTDTDTNLANAPATGAAGQNVILQGRRPQVVIVGGGFGGIHAAMSLAHLPVDVTVLDRRNYHLFQPLLY
jgi:NADH dehydrogenase